MRRAALFLAGVWLAGCAARPGAGGPSALPPNGAGAREAVGLAARSFERRPSVVVLERDGDPTAAVAVDVPLPDVVASTALLAVVEARLAKAGVTGVDGQADRLGLRVRVLAPDGDAAAKATREALRALTTPLDPDPSAQKLAVARVAALSARPADDVALLPLLRCTGQALLAGEAATAPDPAQLEAMRRRAVGWSTVTVGVVGPSVIAARVADAVAKADPWEQPGERANAPVGPAEITYVEPTRRRGTTRVVVARASSDPHEALSLAEPERLLPVTAHLARARMPRLSSVQATAHGSGSCAALELEVEGDLGAAVAAARLLRDELARPVARDASVAARAVARIDDPRDAAAAAALFGRAERADGKPAFVVALGVAPPKHKTPEVEVVRREASAALAKGLAEAGVASSGLEVRLAAEAGQRDAWVALGSTCAASDADVSAGLTAAVVTALAGREIDDVTLEPWVSTSGAGIIAHGPPRDGERPADHARRVARAAAAALLSQAPRTDAIERARLSLLARLDEPSQRGQEPAVSVMGRGRVAHFLPWGSSEGLARLDAASSASRWSALAGGPLRAAIVAPTTVEHATAAAEEIERLTRGSEARSCPAVSGWDRPPGAARTVVAPPGLGPRAYVLAPVDARQPAVAAALAWWAGDPQATATQAARARGVSTRAYLLGDADAALLVVELSGPSGLLDGALAEQVASLSSASKAPADGRVERAVAAALAEDWRARVSPRRRVLELFRGRAPAPPPTTDAVVELARRTFTQANVSTVVLATKAP